MFTVDVSNETRGKTTIGAWQPGRKINLERSLRLGEELGGHIVTGHVDGVARIVDIVAGRREPPLLLRGARAPRPLHRAERARCLDGVSLTVNEVERHALRRQPHPAHLDRDDLGRENPGRSVNLEVDLFARYVARLLEFRP